MKDEAKYLSVLFALLYCKLTSISLIPVLPLFLLHIYGTYDTV